MLISANRGEARLRRLRRMVRGRCGSPARLGRRSCATRELRPTLRRRPPRKCRAATQVPAPPATQVPPSATTNPVAPRNRLRRLIAVRSAPCGSSHSRRTTFRVRVGCRVSIPLDRWSLPHRVPSKRIRASLWKSSPHAGTNATVLLGPGGRRSMEIQQAGDAGRRRRCRHHRRLGGRHVHERPHLDDRDGRSLARSTTPGTDARRPPIPSDRHGLRGLRPTRSHFSGDLLGKALTTGRA